LHVGYTMWRKYGTEKAWREWQEARTAERNLLIDGYGDGLAYVGVWYHGTTHAAWQAAQEEGVLWGVPSPGPPDGRSGYRHTYLTPDLDVAVGFGPVMLEVEYKPVGVDGTGRDNYGFDPPLGQYCWQFSVFGPIPIAQVHVVPEDMLRDLRG